MKKWCYMLLGMLCIILGSHVFITHAEEMPKGYYQLEEVNSMVKGYEITEDAFIVYFSGEVIEDDSYRLDLINMQLMSNNSLTTVLDLEEGIKNEHEGQFLVLSFDESVNLEDFPMFKLTLYQPDYYYYQETNQLQVKFQQQVLYTLTVESLDQIVDEKGNTFIYVEKE